MTPNANIQAIEKTHLKRAQRKVVDVEGVIITKVTVTPPPKGSSRWTVEFYIKTPEGERKVIYYPTDPTIWSVADKLIDTFIKNRNLDQR